MASIEIVNFENAKKSMVGRYESYTFSLDNYLLTEVVKTPHLVIELKSRLKEEQVDKVLSMLLSSLNVLYYEIVDNKSWHFENKNMAKFFHLNTPCEMFYSDSFDTFYLKKQYDFQERYTVAVAKKDGLFYILGTCSNKEAMNYYGEIKQALPDLMKNRDFKLISRKKKTLPDIL